MSVQNPGFTVAHNSASLPTALNATLAAATRRIRFLLALRYVSRALCWSSLPCLIVLGMSKFHLVFETPKPAVLGAVIGTAVLIGLIAAFARRLTPLAVAKATDRRTDLKDRLSSALEFQMSGIDPSAPFYSEQLADAARAVQGVDVRAAYPSRTPKELIAGVIMSLILFGVYFLPSLPMFWSKDKQQEAADVKKRAIEIIKVAEEKGKTADQQKLPETKKAAAEAKKLGEAMEKGKVTKKESMVALQKLLKKMDETQKREAQQNSEKMKQAGADLKRSLDKMQKELEQKQQEKANEKAELAKAQQKPADPRNIQKPGENAKAQQPQQSNAMKKAEEAMRQMADALANQDHQQMKAAMQKMADQMKSGQMSKAEMQQMQKAMQQLAQSLKDGGQQQAGEKMQQMAQQMQQMSSMSAENMAQMAGQMSDQMQKMAEMMGKGEGDGKAMMDMKELDELAKGLGNGSLTKNGKPGFGGDMPGSGIGGSGHSTNPLKDPGATKPIKVAQGKQIANKGVGKNGDAAELAKYMGGKITPPKNLPNVKIAGSRTQNGQELQINMTGDPDAAHSNTPYYQVYQAGKKQAESVLDKENIPATYKEQVKKYFDNIRP